MSTRVTASRRIRGTLSLAVPVVPNSKVQVSTTSSTSHLSPSHTGASDSKFQAETPIGTQRQQLTTYLSSIISNNLHDLNNIPSTFTDNTANMAPSAVADQVAGTASGRPQAVGPPRLYPVKEAHFEGYISPQPDGYRKAQQMGSDNVAIVIDNGMNAARLTISVSLISY